MTPEAEKKLFLVYWPMFATNRHSQKISITNLITARALSFSSGSYTEGIFLQTVNLE